MPSDNSDLRRTLRRIGSVVVVLLAGLLYATVQATDPYAIGRAYHAIVGWTAVLSFWGGLAYLAGTVLVEVPGWFSGEPRDAEQEEASA